MSHLASFQIFVAYIAFGFSAWLAVRLIYGFQPRLAPKDLLRRVLGTTTIVCLLLGTISATISAFSFLSVPLFACGMLIAMKGFFDHRRAEQTSLIWALSTAAEKGIPLPTAAQAVAMERGDILGHQSALLATLLTQGVPFSRALDRTERFWNETISAARWFPFLGYFLSLADSFLHRFPTEVVLASRLGDRLQCLPKTLRESLARDANARRLVTPLIEKLVYFLFVFNVGCVVLTFVVIKIVPVFQKMFSEVGHQLPQATQAFISFAEYCSDHSTAVVSLGVVLFGTVFMAGLYYLGLLPRNLWLVRRLAFPFDRVTTLRALSWGLSRGLPLPAIVDAIGDSFPRSNVQRRLRAVSKAIAGGQDWCDSLRRNGFVTSLDIGVLRAAQQAGNLAWACEELADSKMRRLEYRLKSLIAVGVPLMVLVLGAAVLFFVYAMFLPLVTLIEINA